MFALLQERFTQAEIDDINHVIGPVMGGVTLAHELAYLINQGRSAGKDDCFSGYTEKVWEDDLDLKQTEIEAGQTVLLLDDVNATGSARRESRTAIERRRAHVVRAHFVIVDRFGEPVDGHEVVGLITAPAEVYSVMHCPLCQSFEGVGSATVYPKNNENWARLHQPRETLVDRVEKLHGSGTDPENLKALTT